MARLCDAHDMARAYEDDLRRKIFEAHAKGHGSFRKLAAVFGVSLGYVEKIFRQRAQTGMMERVRHRPGPKSRVSAAVAARMVALVEAEADLTVAELQERIAAETGVRMSWSLVRLWVGRLGLRLKKSHSMPSSATRKRTFNGAKSSSKLSRPSRRNG
jgi:transposase